MSEKQLTVKTLIKDQVSTKVLLGEENILVKFDKYGLAVVSESVANEMVKLPKLYMIVEPDGESKMQPVEIKEELKGPAVEPAIEPKTEPTPEPIEKKAEEKPAMDKKSKKSQSKGK